MKIKDKNFQRNFRVTTVLAEGLSIANPKNWNKVPNITRWIKSYDRDFVLAFHKIRKNSDENKPFSMKFLRLYLKSLAVLKWCDRVPECKK